MLVNKGDVFSSQKVCHVCFIITSTIDFVSNLNSLKSLMFTKDLDHIAEINELIVEVEHLNRKRESAEIDLSEELA